MNRRLNVIDWIALALLVIGGINWGLVGLFQFDAVGAIFGGTSSIISRIIFVLVGIAALYMAFDAFTLEHESTTEARRPTPA